MVESNGRGNREGGLASTKENATLDMESPSLARSKLFEEIWSLRGSAQLTEPEPGTWAEPVTDFEVM